MDSKLKQQLDLYEQGNLEALEDILTPSIYSAPVSQKTKTKAAAATTQARGQAAEQNDEEITIITSEQTNEVPEGTYPALTDTVKTEISDFARDWIKIDETLEKIRKTRTQLDKEKKIKEQQLLAYIEKYGLRDITKGRHQLVPQIQKGKKKSFNKKVMTEKLSDFLGTLDLVEEVDELALQAVDYLDNSRTTVSEVITLKHNRL